VDIWIEDTGGDGFPLVLIHPGWGDAEIWSPVLPALHDRYRVIRYDNRGYGRSPAPAEAFSQVDDLRCVLDRMGVTTAGVVAHSGGGGTALAFALSAPERVSAIVLVAPGVEDYPWPADDPYSLEGGRAYKANDRDGLIELGLRTWAAADPADPVARAQVSSAVTAMFATSGFQNAEPPVYGRLGEISAPAVMVRGDLEYPMVAEAADRIASRIPGCRRVVIPGADHLLPLRTPAALTEIILAHIHPGP
jgi:3-oxoadipate enol-lactonase